MTTCCARTRCKIGIFRFSSRIWILFRCNQMLLTNRNAWFPPCARIVKWATIYYKNNATYFLVPRCLLRCMARYFSVENSLAHSWQVYTSAWMDRVAKWNKQTFFNYKILRKTIFQTDLFWIGNPAWWSLKKKYISIINTLFF